MRAKRFQMTGDVELDAQYLAMFTVIGALAPWFEARGGFHALPLSCRMAFSGIRTAAAKIHEMNGQEVDAAELVARLDEMEAALLKFSHAARAEGLPCPLGSLDAQTRMA